MMLGLGLGLGMSSRAPVPEIDEFAFAAWLEAPFAASPWVGTASAGTSGSNDATEATNPPSAGSTLNGHAVVDFDGTNDQLTLDGTTGSYWTTSAIAGVVWFNADTAGAASTGSQHNERQILAVSDAAVFGVSHSTAGVSVWLLKPSFAWEGITIACGTGGWHRIQFSYDGVTLKAKLDSGTVQTLTVGPGGLDFFGFGGALKLGVGSGGVFFDGKIARVVLANSLTDQEFADEKSNGNARYGLAL